MTAEVAILNSQGAAIAADSAVSIGSKWGRNKIYYTAEKIFCLEEKRPIGIMIYSDAEFMKINMDIIINEYSNDFDRKKFSTLEKYFSDFLNFILEFKYITLEDEIIYFRSICYTICRHIRKLIDDLIKEDANNGILSIENEDGNS